MDEKEIVKQILDSYDEITVINEEDDIVFFKLIEKEYGFLYSLKESSAERPLILVKNEKSYMYPHILSFEIPMDKEKMDKYRYICLHENDNTIKYLQSYEEKIIDAIERLIELLSLSNLEIEHEFQKEFLYYWNDLSENKSSVMLYIGKNRMFKRMNAYYNNSKVRFIANEINLTDKDEKKDGKKLWNHNPELPVFYIPITDNRRILPPTRDNLWNKKNILMIVNGRDYSRISDECYEKISQEKVKTKMIGLVFEMLFEGNSINFCAIITFKNATNNTLLNKLKNDINKVRVIKSKRVDYYYLCRQIGNDTLINDKKVIVIGAGSLGSYVAKELVKSGICNLTIYDSDVVEDENILRHTVENFWVNTSKVIALKYDLEQIHPEIHVKAVPKDINDEELKEEMQKNDLIIFTVGSSDVQLVSNNVLRENAYEKPVIYTWLEAGGVISHILTVDYLQKGCYECLFTDDNGSLINNKANKLNDEQVEHNTIRNGCGGTRVAYGTGILLRTASVLLDTVKRLFNGEIHENTLIDIEPTAVLERGNIFYERKCHCCGDKNC